MITVQKLAQDVAEEMFLVQGRHTKVLSIKKEGITAKMYFDVDGQTIEVLIYPQYIEYFSLEDIIYSMLEILDKREENPQIFLN